MNARDLIKRAAGSGVTLRLVEGKVKAAGSHEALAELVPQLRECKAELIEFLQQASAANNPATPEPKIQPSAAPPVPDQPARPAKQTFMEWQDTWRELDQAYQRHHFNCPTCIAAGLGYGLRCGAGAALYTAYSDVSERPEKKGRP